MKFKKIFGLSMIGVALTTTAIVTPLTLTSCNTNSKVDNSNQNNSKDNFLNKFKNVILTSNSTILNETNTQIKIEIKNLSVSLDQISIKWYCDNLLLEEFNNLQNITISENGVYKVEIIDNQDTNNIFSTNEIIIKKSINSSIIQYPKISLNNLNVSYSNNTFDENNLDAITVSINNIPESIWCLLQENENKRFSLKAIKDNQEVNLPITLSNNSISYKVDLSSSVNGIYGFKFIDNKITDENNFAYSTKTISSKTSISIGENLLNLDNLNLSVTNNGILNVENNSSVTIEIENIPSQLKGLFFDFYDVAWLKQKTNLNISNSLSYMVNEKGTYECTITKKNSSDVGLNSNFITKTLSINVENLNDYKNVKVNFELKNLNTIIGSNSSNTFNNITFNASIVDSQTNSLITNSGGYILKLDNQIISQNQDCSINMNNINNPVFKIYKTLNGKEILINTFEFENWNIYKQTLIINNQTVSSKTDIQNSNVLNTTIIPTFLKEKNYQNIYVEGNFTEISDSTNGIFQEWNSLKNVYFKTPNLNKIGFNAFDSCASLANVEMITSNSITLGNDAFNKNDNLSNISFVTNSTDSTNQKTNANIISIGNNCFYKTTKLTNLEIGNQITIIGSSAFRNSGISNITLQNCTELQSIGQYAFNDSKIKTIDISKSTKLKSIGLSAFRECSLLNTFIYYGNDNLESNVDSTSLDGINEIGSYAFSGCNRLSKFYPSSYSTKISSLNNFIYISDSVKKIGSNAFELTKNLQTVEHFPESITELPHGIFKQSGLKEFNFKNSNITTIGENSLADIINLGGDYSFSNSINKLDMFSLSGINCNSLTLSKNIKTINSFALANANINTLKINFSSIVSNTTTPDIFSETNISNIEFGDNVTDFNQTDSSVNELITSEANTLTLEQLFSSLSNKENIKVVIGSNADALKQKLISIGFNEKNISPRNQTQS